MVVSQVSPLSRTPFPHTLVQSLSVVESAPGGQQPSSLAAAVIAPWTHSAEHSLPGDRIRRAGVAVVAAGRAGAVGAVRDPGVAELGSAHRSVTALESARAAATVVVRRVAVVALFGALLHAVAAAHADAAAVAMHRLA